MGKQVTLGGDRLGSGNKNKVQLPNYGRSTHNLTTSWKSTMAPGILYPFYCKPAMNGDVFEIDMKEFIRTIPTRGPLYGSFKFQADMFIVPMRLYQAILHNNPMNIGLRMNEVKLPKMSLGGVCQYGSPEKFMTSQVSTNALVKYLGISGYGQPNDPVEAVPEGYVSRSFNAVPVLGYYDIFKNYYANKQEKKAYVISPTAIDESTTTIEKIIKYTQGSYGTEYNEGVQFVWGDEKIAIIGTNLTLETIRFGYASGTKSIPLYEAAGISPANPKGSKIRIINVSNTRIEIEKGLFYNYQGNVTFGHIAKKHASADIKLVPFNLENIDNMRMEILSNNNFGSTFMINTFDYLPYSTIWEETDGNISYNSFKQNGLVVKTYQSDLFNNWINTDWIDGDNGIAAITAVDTSQGFFEIDALNLAQKVYNMLNAIAASGGTYEDWQDAVFDENAMRHAETPIYCGGMSAEVMFEEVISTSESETSEGTNPLGSLGGRGKAVNDKGGHLTIDVNEPSFIMGICSLTPRLDYTQGNEWYMTDLDSVDDLHKPALDGIGFEPLMTERMVWFDTLIGTDDNEIYRSSVGKVPAWINYMTDIDRAYGDFAEQDGKAFMILGRNYTFDDDGHHYQPNDITTYVDPAKFNYAFAYQALDAQNFWTQIVLDIKARRKMSAKIIPNI